MIEKEINNTIDAIGGKRNNLVSFLRERVRSIAFPEEQPVPNEPTQAKEGYLPIALAGGGGLVLIIGLCTNTIILSILGGGILAVGIYTLYQKKKNQTDNESNTIGVDYSKFSNNVYKVLESANSHIAKGWDSFVGQQNAQLANSIKSLSVDDNVKSGMMDKIARRSQIRFSMMDAFSELTSASRSENLSQIKFCMNTLVEKYVNEIDRAYREQRDVYLSLK